MVCLNYSLTTVSVTVYDSLAPASLALDLRGANGDLSLMVLCSSLASLVGEPDLNGDLLGFLLSFPFGL